MVRIEVDLETAKKIEVSSEPIELYATDGRQIGYFSHAISNAEIAEARRLALSPSDGASLDEVWSRILTLIDTKCPIGWLGFWVCQLCRSNSSRLSTIR